MAEQAVVEIRCSNLLTDLGAARREILELEAHLGYTVAR